MYTRKLAPIVEEFLGEFRILYLPGPRQAGKTTLVRQLAERLGMKYLTFDQQAVQQSAAQDPHGFIEAIGDKKIALDEFQYIPELIPAIKAASDQLTPNTFGKFLLTGSADIFRSAKAQEALPGHMARLELYPLSVSEIIGSDFNLIDYLQSGDFTSGAFRLNTAEPVASWILQLPRSSRQKPPALSRLGSTHTWKAAYSKTSKPFMPPAATTIHASKPCSHGSLDYVATY